MVKSYVRPLSCDKKLLLYLKLSYRTIYIIFFYLFTYLFFVYKYRLESQFLIPFSGRI